MSQTTKKAGGSPVGPSNCWSFYEKRGSKDGPKKNPKAQNGKTPQKVERGKGNSKSYQQGGPLRRKGTTPSMPG